MDSQDPTSTAVTAPADSSAAPSDWSLLVDTGPVDAWCSSWLRIQTNWIGRVGRAAVVRRATREGEAQWLAALGDEDRRALEEQVMASFAVQRSLAAPSDGASDRFGVSYYAALSGGASLVVAVEVTRGGENELAEVLRQLQWGALWLEQRLGGGGAGLHLDGRPGEGQASSLIDLIALTLDANGFDEAAQALVSQLARLLVCDRVSLGIERGGSIRVAAISHAAAFGREMNLVRAVEAAMNEAVDQNTSLVFPSEREDAPIMLREHEALSRDQGSASVLTIPLGRDDSLRGALLFEHPEAGVFDAERVAVLEAVALAVTPILELWRREDRPIYRKVLDAARVQLERLFGPGYLGRKLTLAIIALLLLFFIFAHGDYRIGAQGALEGASRRVVIAPFDGFVASAERRAGDFVKEGDVLARLDDRELELERLKWSSRLIQLTRQADESRAGREYGRTRILSAQIDEARAEVSRLEERLSRTRVAAPFDGLVVSGDLTQSLGGAVSRGDVLFEVAPLERYRVLLEVDEEQIAEVELGQRGSLLLAALPGEPLPFEVTKVTPVATAQDGRNFFRVEGTLEEASTVLRPGMEGVGKIDVDERRLVWIWTRGFRNWLRLWVWSWWP